MECEALITIDCITKGEKYKITEVESVGVFSDRRNWRRKLLP